MNDYFECSCHSPEHTLRFTFDDDPKYPAIYVCVFLSEGRLATRIWNAIRYVLGYKCRYGHFDEFILQREDCDRLVSIIDKFKNSGKLT